MLECVRLLDTFILSHMEYLLVNKVSLVVGLALIVAEFVRNRLVWLIQKHVRVRVKV